MFLLKYATGNITMPPIQPPDLVLVTGASGFLGTHFVAALKEAGFQVRGAVRLQEQGEYIKKRWGAEYVVVPDMTVPNAYDEAVDGVKGIVHASSEPDVTHTGDAADVITPAVAGVQNMLSAISRDGSVVSRVVQISSGAAVSIDSKGTHNEEEWNDHVVKQAKIPDVPPPYKYHASKVVSERAFWKFFEMPRPCDGIALLPGYVFGVPTEFDTTKGEVTGSPAVLIPWLTTRKPAAALHEPFYPSVDVRDVTEAAINALTRDVGGRFLLSPHPTVGNDFALAAGQLHDPDLLAGIDETKFRESLVKDAGHVDCSRAVKELGITFRGKDEMLNECVQGVWAVLHGKEIPT